MRRGIDIWMDIKAGSSLGWATKSDHVVCFSLIATPSPYPTAHEMHAESFAQCYPHLGSNNEPVCGMHDGYIIAERSDYLSNALEAMHRTFTEKDIIGMIQEGYLGDACSILLDFHCKLATVIRGTEPPTLAPRLMSNLHIPRAKYCTG